MTKVCLQLKTKGGFMTKEEKIYTLRIEAGLLDYLKTRADQNKRSIAKEIEFIVEQLREQDKAEIQRRAQIIKEILGDNITTERIIELISNNDVMHSPETTLNKLSTSLKSSNKANIQF